MRRRIGYLEDSLNAADAESPPATIKAALLTKDVAVLSRNEFDRVGVLLDRLAPVGSQIHDDHDELLLAEGLNAAFVGVVERFGQADIACYDVEQVLQSYLEQGSTREDAEEFFRFNVVGAWAGERTPCFLHRTTVEELLS